MTVLRAAFFSLALCLSSCDAPGQATNRQPSESPAQFVQNFLDWYMSTAQQSRTGPAFNMVLEFRPLALAPDLRRELKIDSDAQAKVSGEIVGLDSDPFLASQDPCERYETGKTVRTGLSYWIEVFGVCGGKRREDPDVIAEVVNNNGAWAFANVHYPLQNSDLRTVLKLLRKDRH